MTEYRARREEFARASGGWKERSEWLLADGAFFIGFTGYIHRAAAPGSCYAFILAAWWGLNMLIVAAIAINTKWAFHSSLTHRFFCAA